MKYFTPEIWSEMNSESEQVQLAAHNKWEHNAQVYAQEFEKIKNRFAPKFLKQFLFHNEFHDYRILDICLLFENCKKSCELVLSNGNTSMILRMMGLVACNLKIESFDSCVQGMLSWGYCEFDKGTPASVTLSILCDPRNELWFEFKSIELVERAVPSANF